MVNIEFNLIQSLVRKVMYLVYKIFNYKHIKVKFELIKEIQLI